MCMEGGSMVGWICCVEQIETIEGMEVVVRCYNEARRLVYSTNSIEDMFRQLPEYSVVEFCNGKYLVDRIICEAENVCIVGREILDLPTIVANYIEFSKYTQIMGLRFVGARIEHSGKLHIMNCKIEDCLMSDFNIFNSRIHRSEIISSAPTSEYGHISDSILESCRLRNVYLGKSIVLIDSNLKR